MRYLMIHWIDEGVLADSGAIESEVEAWTAEMDRRGVRLQGEPLRSVTGAATYGSIWAEAMAKTLERLDALCARQGNQPSPA